MFLSSNLHIFIMSVFSVTLSGDTVTVTLGGKDMTGRVRHIGMSGTQIESSSSPPSVHYIPNHHFAHTMLKVTPHVPPPPRAVTAPADSNRDKKNHKQQQQIQFNKSIDEFF